jgi:replicative DNA helicase
MAHIGEIEGLRLKTFDRVRSLTDIRRTARALKSAGRLDVLIVDTVHLVTESGGAYDKSLAVSNGLRSLAIELDIVVVGICQFKGGYDEGEQGSKRPQRHWIKDGTHMIQDPTDILLLHRPDPLAPKVEVIFDKRRHGKPGRIVDLMLREEFARYDNWSNR